MNLEELEKLIIASLEEMKAQEIRVIDVRGKTSVTDLMVVASGTSSRHVQAIAGNVALRAKEAGILPLGIEGEREGEWTLVDLNDAVVHVMQPAIREFYGLERLWLTEGGEEEPPERGLPARGG